MEKRRILLLDDSALTLQQGKDVLEARGYEVTGAATLTEFERLLGEFKPELVLADVELPGTVGADVCRTLKNGYHTQDIPIVLFSALGDEQLAALAGQVGADGFISKARGLEALGEKVDELVASILW